MPKSSTSVVESEVYDVVQSETNTIDAKPKIKTIEMVHQALLELHKIKGTNLKQIYAYISENFKLGPLTTNRINIIKKYLKSLWQNEEIVTVTGKGLSASFKLQDKKIFLKNVKNQKLKEKNNLKTKNSNPNYQANKDEKAKKLKTKEIPSLTKNSNTNYQANKDKKAKKLNTKKIPSLRHNPPVIPRQVTPTLPQNSPIFDTPFEPALASSSQYGAILRAPELRQRTNKTKSTQGDNGTPRSSLPEKKRKLLKRSEK